MAANMQYQRPPIRRNRTGCFTCRRRKKKCDESKPQCVNCQRNGIICGGYPNLVFYEMHQSRPSGSCESQRLQEDEILQPLDRATALDDDSNLFDEDLGFLFEGNIFFDPIIGENDIIETTGTNFDLSSGLNLESDSSRNALVLQTAAVESFASSPQRVDRCPPSSSTTSRFRPQLGSSSRLPALSVAHDEVPFLNELPFLLDNVNTSIERRLFLHFTTLTSRVLTLSSGKHNPLTSIVVPLASKDEMVMQSLLSLAGSHLVSISQGGSVSSINLEKYRLHDLATRTQARRVRALERSGDKPSPRELEAILTSALLLCLYEICEGSGDATWRLHLDTARKLISWTVTRHKRESEGRRSTSVTLPLLPGINRFLLEFFIYHDTLAAVTVTSSSPILSPKNFQLESSGAEEIYVVGVNDGLCDLITRIAALRSQAMEAPANHNGDLLCDAVAIWDDLAKWKPNSLDPEQRLIGSLYQWALFIWLYCIVHPDGIADAKLQIAVKRAIEDLEKVTTASSVLSCLLFPLFIIGTTSIEEVDRSIVKGHFQSLTAWSGLGNVKIAQEIVQRSWESHDNDIPRSWDWMPQMELHGISVPVT